MAAQQLLFWGEVMRNGDTLGDNFVETGSSLHLVCGTRDTRNTRALSSSSDGYLRLWSLSDAEPMSDLAVEAMTVLSLAVDWEGMRALGGCHDGGLHLWDLRTGAKTVSLRGHSGEIITVLVNWPGMVALSGSA